METIGFTNITTEIITTKDYFDTNESFKAWIKVWLPHLKVLNKELHDQFVDDIIARYLSYNTAFTSNKILYEDYFIKVIAEKK